MSDNKVETELLSQIKEVLLKFPKYWEKDVLLRNKVAEDLRNYNQELIEALLSNQLVKDTYSITLNSTNIFKIEEFISMLRYKNYWENSYTKYSNEIGLTSEGKYLNYNTDVVLDFPHKDSVLEGGMTKEDQGKKEIYYHNVLAKEEIDTLLSPKVLTNLKKYDKNGEHDIDDFTDKDNLIIKGNNLVALNSLKERYENQVKACFIDPPYFFNSNKPADTFAYNSNFKLSSWLVFMRNRLEIAKELLKNDGIIYITISSEGAHYLKVLADSVFNIENFIADITWQSRKSVSSDSLISVSSNHLLVYSKNIKNINKEEFRLFLDTDNFKYDDNDGKGLYRVEPFDAPNIRKNLEYGIENPNTGEVYYPPRGRCWRTTYDEYKSFLKENKIRFGSKGTTKPQLKVYLKEARKLGKGKTSTTLWNDIVPDSIVWKETGTTTTGTKHQQKIFGEVVFENPKPEDLVSRALQLSTDDSDLVLDFFMGSSTTQAVAHKMGRQYIGIEQMDYINTVSVPRLQKVIEGEQGGISKDVDWKGGGSFVYAELASLNERYVKDIQQASNEAELEKVLSTMKESAYLNFKVDLERVSSKDEGYHALSLEERKEVLIQVLDMNQLYLSYSEIEDEQYKIPEDIKVFNHSFYQKEGVKDE